MILRFNITYYTNFGQKLMICGTLPELGNMKESAAREMFPVDPENGKWDLEVDIQNRNQLQFDYRYFVFDENTGIKLYEWGDRKIDMSPAQYNLYEINDNWRAYAHRESAFFSSVFTEGLYKPSKIWSKPSFEVTSTKSEEYIVRFQINLARIKSGHRVGITGDAQSLGKWDVSQGIKMANTNHPQWSADVKVKKTELPLNYKYFLYDEEQDRIEFLESADNRVLDLNTQTENTCIIQTDEYFRFPSNQWKGAGVAIPVFSLRRKNGYGIGEFTDIKLLVDWAKKTGMKLIQLLPVNDTIATHTWKDSYPYASISVFALHPVYANLSKMGKLSSPVTRQVIEEQGKALDKKDKVDYEGVMQLKSRFFKMLFDEQKEQFLKDPDFLTFFKNNKYWLKPYAAFSYLRDLFNTPNFHKWGRFKEFSRELLEELTDPDAPHYDDIAVHYFIQYHLDKQLSEAANYARENGVVLKGDIPIGIYRHSVDAWMEPKLFNLEKQAGAPPDDFAEGGQNWGFPTYNWQEMAKDGYKWWRNRLKKMAEYFDAFRIDHILGFFRIWEIPYESIQGLMGYFNPAIPYHKDELIQDGIDFNYTRLCQPYIREHFLHEFFGEFTEEAKEKFLEETEFGCYQVKPDYDTQRKVANRLKPEPDETYASRSRKQTLKEGMYRLLAEVIFLRALNSDGEAYFPRNSLQFTHSFRDLDDYTKDAINSLYVDFFYKRNEELWRQKAMFKLPAVKRATNMLICGEDLGMVPESVPEVMKNLGILSLEIQRMPKDRTIEFNTPANYPYYSVASTSSHDMPSIRGWWEEDPERSQRFFNTILGNEGASPFFCETWIARQILEQHFYAPSMWVILPLHDILAISSQLRRTDAREERINNPAKPEHYWRYRFHLSMEELMQEDEFNTMLFELVKDSGRFEAY